MDNEDEGAKVYHGRPMVLDYQRIKRWSRKGIAVSLDTWNPREFLHWSILIDLCRGLDINKYSYEKRSPGVNLII